MNESRNALKAIHADVLSMALEREREREREREGEREGVSESE